MIKEDGHPLEKSFRPNILSQKKYVKKYRELIVNENINNGDNEFR
jgi:hypothetical protein